MARQVIGIDFGTTYSSVATMAIGATDRPVCHQFSGARDHTPSILLTDVNDQSVISWGWEALRAMRSHQDVHVQRYFKRDLGSSSEAEVASGSYLNCIFETLCRKYGVTALGEADFVTAFGVPANWTEDQLDLLKRLATEVGFPDVRLLPEPVAAMHSLRVQPDSRIKFGDRPEKFMVIDFGGGTLDICVVQTQELGRHPEILSTEGDPRLGGVDFDELIEALFLRQANLDIATLSDVDRSDLRHEIEKAKEYFSEAFTRNDQSARTFIRMRNDDKEFILKKVVFENCCHDQRILAKLEGAVSRALQTAALKPGDIKYVILTGGSSKWHLVREVVSKAMGVGGPDILHTSTPFTDVACGLAIHVGRSDEPPEKPGVWVRMRVDSGKWEEYKVVLHPGRTDAVRTQERLVLGVLDGSQVLRSRSIDLQWAHGTDPNRRTVGLESTIQIYARSNHPKVEMVGKGIDFLRRKNVAFRADRYEVFLLYHEDVHGHPHYALEIQDNRDRCRQVTVVPGEDVFFPWFGTRRPLRRDRAEMQASAPPSKKPNADMRGARLLESVRAKLSRKDCK